MAEQLSTGIITIYFIIIMLVPRQWGMLPANCNVRTRQLTKSKIWLFYSIVCGISFAILYPLSMFAISPKTRSVSQGDIFIFIEITNHAAMYLFSLAVYLRIILFAKTHIDYCNAAFSVFDKCKFLSNDNNIENTTVISFVIRGLYSYFGYAALNAIKLIQNSENLKTVHLVYIYTYFVPDIIMASTMMRFHTTISLQIVCCNRINQALVECMEMMKVQALKPGKKSAMIQSYLTQRFDQIVECHRQLYEVTRGTEPLAGNLLIFYILKAFAHLSSMLFLIIDHMSSNTVWNTNFITVGALRCLFSLMDLIFTFTPASQLKKEYHKVGVSLYRGSQANLPVEFQRSVEQFSIYILHQRKCINVKGLFDLDNQFFYQLIGAIIAYLLFFMQFRTQ